MGRPGLEPGTNRLKAEYSTIELATQIRFIFLFFFLQLFILAQVYFFYNYFLEKN